MRLKIKLTVQKEVTNGAIMQQATVVEFVRYKSCLTTASLFLWCCRVTYLLFCRRNQQCKNCEAYYAQGAWHAIVQVRQHVAHKRTFFYLEQLLLKHNAHSECLQIQVLDFFVTPSSTVLQHGIADI